jgi:hypothetical protein
MSYNNDTPIGTVIPFAGYYFYSLQSFEKVKQLYIDISEEDYFQGVENANSLAENGWLLCDGKQYLLTKDPTNPLFKICKTLSLAWGGNIIPTGNTFRLPNLQGLFLRGVDFSSLNDPESSSRVKLYPNDTYGQSGKQVGSFQKDAFAKHSHSLSVYRTEHPNGSASRAGNVSLKSERTGEEGISEETRPKNVYVHYLIKAAHQSLDLWHLQEENQTIE